MREGAIITSGLEDWQILQQTGGFAEIGLSGWQFSSGIDPSEPVDVLARVVREDDSGTIVPWTPCACNGMYWNVRLRVPSGGLYRLETRINSPSAHGFSVLRGDMRHHFGVGDIFVIAGQSNAGGRGPDPVFDPPELGVHQLRNSGVWGIASHPLSDSTDAVYLTHREPDNPAHGPFLAFAKRLKAQLGYPIGLIQTALGGSGLWHWDASEDGALLSNMLRMLRDHAPKISGVLWYQGCTDAMEKRDDDYYERFRAVVGYTREALCDAGLPWLTVQLNRFAGERSPDNDRNWGRVREAQRRAALDIPGVYIVPTLGLELCDAIHNSGKANLILAERAVNCALAELYGKPRDWRAPEIISARLEGRSRVIARFSNISQKINAGPGGASFTAEDGDGLTDAVSAETVDKDMLQLDFERPIKKGAVLHGAWRADPPAPAPSDGDRIPMLSFYGFPIAF